MKAVPNLQEKPKLTEEKCAPSTDASTNKANKENRPLTPEANINIEIINNQKRMIRKRTASYKEPSSDEDEKKNPPEV